LYWTRSQFLLLLRSWQAGQPLRGWSFSISIRCRSSSLYHWNIY
jgi:hypothetical protein